MVASWRLLSLRARFCAAFFTLFNSRAVSLLCSPCTECLPLMALYRPLLVNLIFMVVVASKLTEPARLNTDSSSDGTHSDSSASRGSSDSVISFDIGGNRDGGGS